MRRQARLTVVVIESHDDGELAGLRYENRKVVFMEQRAPGTLRIWAEPSTTLRLPKLFDLRADPYERADVTSNTYYDWLIAAEEASLQWTAPGRRSTPCTKCPATQTVLTGVRT